MSGAYAETSPPRLDAFAAAWTALSRLLLRPPLQGDLERVRDAGLLAVWPLDRDEATVEGLALLEQSTEDVTAVRDDFHRLFVGPRVVAHPWESVHRSEEHLLFDESTMQVRKWYARYALAAPRLNREPDDHIGLELEFLAHLAQLALHHPDRTPQVMADVRSFLTDHVAPWAPQLAQLIIDQAHSMFYRGIGRLLAGTVAQSVAVFGSPSGAGHPGAAGLAVSPGLSGP